MLVSHKVFSIAPARVRAFFLLFLLMSLAALAPNNPIFSANPRTDPKNPLYDIFLPIILSNRAAHFQPFGTVVIQPDFELNGQGSNIDSLAFWEAPNSTQSLLLVTAKDNQLVEVWQYPFANRQLAPLTHSSFGSKTQVNGIAIDQKTDRLYIVVSEPASTVSVFSLPQLQFIRQFISGSVNLRSEPNIALLKHRSGQTWAYVSADKVIYIHNAETGNKIGEFTPTKRLETMVADDVRQVIYVPDENNKTGVYAYNPDGTPFKLNNTHNFGGNGIFESDGEGIILYSCPSNGASDNGQGFIVVSDQKKEQNDFEFFNRQTWQHLGTLRIEGVYYTDGIASTQQASPRYPLGLFAAVRRDTSVFGVGWDKILAATGLRCG